MKSCLLIFTAFLFSGAIYAQLTGQKSIPGDYATIAMAIDSLNAGGVGAGGVTFNIASGHMETFPAATSGLITATGSATDPVVFRKNGEGNNPVITSFGTAPGTTDYLICLQGCDYVTFDGIDLSDPSGVTEWGYAVLKSSPVNGSQNITIKNSTISLKKTNTATYGIYSNNHTPSSATLLTITATGGQNTNNKFYGNIISNSYGGIYINGFAGSAAPYIYYDQGNDIGSVAGNSFTNFGGGTTSCYQVYMACQNNFTIANCNINGGAGTTGATYGVYGGAAINATGAIYGNTIQLNTSGITASVYGIYNSGLGATGSSNGIMLGSAGGGLADATLTVDWNLPGLQWASGNYKNENGCMAEAPAFYQVTVTPAFTAGIAETDQEICSGTLPALLTATLPAGGIQPSGFQWQSPIDNMVFRNIPTATDQNYQPEFRKIIKY